MANFVRKLLLLAVFIAPSLVIISADPLVPGVQGNDAPNPNNAQCITMTDARAQEVKQIIQEITDFIDNLAVKHEYFDVKLLKLDIGKYNGDSDSNTGLDLIVDDCQKPSAYDFSGDFSADSDDDDKSDVDTTTPVKKTYQVTHSSRDTQTNYQQVNQQTQTQTLDSINNQNGNNLDAANTASNNDYESHADALNDHYHYSTTDIVPTTDSTFVDDPYQATNNVGTDQHDSATQTQTFTDNQQVVQQNVANQQYGNQNQQYDKNQQQGPIQQYGGNPPQNVGQVQQYVGNAQQTTDNQQYSNVANQGNAVNQQQTINNAQQSIDVNKQQYTNVVQQNTIESQQNTATTQQLTKTNVQQLKQTDTVNNLQSTDQVQQITDASAVTNAQQITENKQQSVDTQEFQSIVKTDNRHLSQTSINEISQGYVEKDENTFQQINNQREGSSDNGNDQRFNNDINKNNNNQVSQNPRYRIETLLLQSLKELVRIVVKEQTRQSLNRPNTHFDRKNGGQALNYQKTGNGRRNGGLDRPYANDVRGNTNFDGQYVNYGENNDYYNAAYVKYSGVNENYDRADVNYDKANVNYERKNINYDRKNINFDRANGFDIRDNRYANNRYGVLKYGQNRVVSYGNDNQPLSKPTTKFIELIPNYLLEKKYKDANGRPLLVHIASTPGFQQVTIL